MKEKRTVHTSKELMEIAGHWTTVEIRNDYRTGSNHFTLTYNGESVTYQNDDIKNVALTSNQYNGISSKELARFLLDEYFDAHSK